MPAAIPQPPVPASELVLCPRCSAGFGCGAKAGACWCAEVMVSDDVRGDLAGFYDGCLCRECLQLLEDARPPKPNIVEFLKKNLRRER